MAEDLVKLLVEHVEVGVPLPFDVLDLQNRLLLRKGSVVDSETQLERLLERGLYLAQADFAEHFGAAAQQSGPGVAPAVLESAWARLLQLQARLAQWLDAPFSGAQGATGSDPSPDGSAAAAALQHMACEVSALCALDGDAMLGAMTLLRHPSYCVRHSLCTALLTEMMLRRSPMPEAQRMSTVAGALAMNLAMRHLQDALYAQREPLDEEQKRAIQAHPTGAIPLLQAAGVTDTACLAVVSRHHEHADGTGYPGRLTSPTLDLGSQTVALADRYCALIGERAYRDGAPADQALKLLRERVGTALEPVVVRLLVHEVGDYPPGCPVRLVNQETGIVVSRTRDPGSRVVKALRSALNAVYDDGPRRLTGQPAFAIERVIKLSELGIDVDPAHLWGDTAKVGLR
ncbi:MAG TPA: HD domain-containing phosphohydrolase [Burkholderiaceae bacterium]|nr:HD domain-containing phosphohydrolase [Burkholderiaceae bacterium]